MEPTYNGDPIFGVAVTMNHDDSPNATQVNHYPGTIGVERLDLGPVEARTTVRGTIVGVTPQDLGAACQAVRAIKVSAIRGTLVDTDGVTWIDAVIESFHTTGRSAWAPGWGWCRDYEMTIVHTGLTGPEAAAAGSSTGGGG